jgi:predicted RNA-binding Zn-ribbon protein involved in translation (DUF1610 family)
MTKTEKPELDYKDFCTKWANAVTSASKGDPMAMMLMNLAVTVRCRSCGKLVNGEDAARGSELYCPSCGVGWVLRQNR